MKKAERDSFLKSFGIFFLSIWTLSATLIYFEHAKNIHDLNEKIYREMRVCSFDLKCKEFTFDFEPFLQADLYSLKESDNELYALFTIPKNDNYALKISLSKKRYELFLSEIKIDALKKLFFASIAILILSALFSIYTLNPLRRALSLTQEFSRDILHDLATPLAAIRINLERLSVAPGDEKKVERIKNSIESIVSLGNNLRSYLSEHQHQVDSFDIRPMLDGQLEMYQKIYPNLKMQINGDNFNILANKDAISRVFDNIIGNACKYNKDDGWVEIEIIKSRRLIIVKDGGIGMRNPQMAFNRFYKEGERGVGIGLNIVKKLCDSSNIKINMKSKQGVGTQVTLDMRFLKGKA